jgi:serine/threonine protein phosphatase PrpC
MSLDVAASVSRSMQIVSEFFEVVGASVAGPKRHATGSVCQDFFTAEASADWIVAIVSDGAGSATRSLEGARIVSEEVCQALTVRLKSHQRPHHAADWRARLKAKRLTVETNTESLWSWVQQAVVDGIDKARERCLNEARAGDLLRSFHATVLGVVIRGEGGIFFHIGDGGASAHNVTEDRVETHSFSEPERGEYANETFFFTEARWREHLRLTKIPGAIQAVWLMSDGAYDLMVPPGQTQLRQITVKEIDRLVFDHEVGDKSGVLSTILASSQATDRNDDDKTLVIVRKRETAR